jgi:3-oxoacid CoA-transferase
VVSLIITDLCVFAVLPAGGGLVLRELHPGVTLAEVRARTGCDFSVGLPA